MNDIRHIVFDLGKVLLQWDPELPYRRLIPDEAARRHFLTNTCNPDWNNEQDRGRTWREAEDLLIAEYPEYEDLIRAYREHWTEMMPGHLEDTLAVLEALLAQGRDVTALTNFAADTFVEALNKAGAKSVEYIKIDGAGHGVFGQHAKRTHPAMEKFFATHLAEKPQAE